MADRGGLMLGEKNGLEPGTDVPHVLIAGADLTFVPAQARVDGTTVLASSAQVPAPVAVRYAWRNLPANPLLCNREGLAACSFRTDAGP